jgi:ribosomal-protein-alanine N-acetyltransferase
METERLQLRKRTRQIDNKVLSLSTNEQLGYLGFASIEELNIELNNIRKRLAGNNSDGIKWDLLHKDSHDVIGNCGFHNWLVEHERAEIGYYLHEKYRGNGFMHEGLVMLIEYGFNKMNLNRIEAYISPDNFPSIKIIEKLGFTHEGILKEHYKFKNQIYDSRVYSLLKSEYRILESE